MDNNEKPVVVAGVDGSDTAKKALRWAERYAKATGASIRLVTAWQWPLKYSAPLLVDADFLKRDAQKVASEAVAELGLPTDRIQAKVLKALPQDALLRACKNADLLVLGSKGHSAIAGLLLGSVSDYCLRHASIPVVIVH